MKKIRNLKNKSVIILGSTGLIGKNIVDSFLESGAQVIGVDLNNGLLKKQENKYEDKSFETICADITNTNRIFNKILSKKIKRYRCCC